MIIHRHHFDHAYKQIIKHALSNSQPVLIYVSPETDSLCATKILTVNIKKKILRNI
jgi:hypothetical protein